MAMRKLRVLGAWAALLATGVAEAGAQQTRRIDCEPTPSANRRTAGQTVGQPSNPQFREYDIVVEVPELCVETLTLNVADLDAHLSLNARVANLVRVQAGADVAIARVDLGIRGIEAEALLLVDLDNVVYIVDRALTFIDNNPEVISQLVGTVQNTVRTVGGVANTALQPGGVVSQTVGAVGQTLDNVTRPGGVLSQTVNTLGQTVQTTVGNTGDLVERTLDTAGNVVSQRSLGNLSELPLLSESTNAAGQTVRRVRSQAGQIIEYTVGAAGEVLNSRIVGQ